MAMPNSRAESKVAASILRWQIISTAAFLVLLGLFVISAMIVARSVGSLQSTHDRFVAETDAARDIDEIELLMTAAESSQRGYLVTHDEGYLSPFNATLAQLRPALESAASMTRLDSDIAQDFQDLKKLVNDKVTEMNRTVKIAQTSGFDAASQVVTQGEGRAYMDDIQRLSNHMRQKANLDAEATVAMRQELSSETRLNLVLSTIAVALFLLIAYVMSLRSIESNRRDQVLREQRSEDLEEAVRERTTELTTAMKELEGFTYSVSHDMRAPLRWIVASSQIILEDHGKELATEASELLKRQITAGNKMSKLIDDLLSYARLGRQPIEKSQIDLVPMARNLLAREPDAELVAPVSLIANGDPTLLEVVMQNLLENAAKYRSAERPLVVTIGKEDEAYFVRDNGIGFDLQYVNKIFIPFERLHRDAEYPGTGIGLANVQRIVTRHGGKVWAESQVGEGSTFYFALP